MADAIVSMQVRRVNDAASVIEIKGDVTAAAEDDLMNAYGEAADGATKVVGLDFSGLEYMNSSGIGLLVTLLVRANRQKQRLVAFGLTDHYRQIFTLTRLDDAIKLFDSEDEAFAAAGVAT
ncbi:MAG TPA: STAS domain-containing protein [Egibacteraceae bacterium]|nr:STAS domain-containing protein [Egibacteraceae bacterium]